MKATLAGERIETTVDSELARYYLERYLQGHRDDPALDRLITEAVSSADSSPLTRELLRDLARRFSPDFAALYVATRLLDDPASRPFRTLYERELAALRALSTVTAATDERLRSYSFLLVPGWVYRSVRETGADLARQRQILTERGVENRLIEIEECGTIEENAEIIAADLKGAANVGKRIILVSASSGGASTAQALGRLLDAPQRQNVKAWINVGGLLQGSMTADRVIRMPRRLLTKLILFVKGWNYASIVSMTTGRSRERWAATAVPPELFCVNFMGIPLSGTISPRVRSDYRYANAEGPNDGMTLITDALVPHGVTIVVPGADHYHGDTEADLRTVALGQAVVAHLEAREQAAGARPNPPR